MGDNQADAPVHHASNSDNFVVVTDPNKRRVRRWEKDEYPWEQTGEM